MIKKNICVTCGCGTELLTVCFLYNGKTTIFFQFRCFWNYTIHNNIVIKSMQLQQCYKGLPGVWQIVGLSPSQVKPKTIILVFVTSPLRMQHHGDRAKTGLLIIKIMCQSGTTCLPTNCCFSKLALKIQLSVLVQLVQSGHHYLHIKCNLFTP